MTSDLYVLDDNDNVVKEPDILKWGRFFENQRDRRIVKQEHFGTAKEIMVSTVFLGMDHGWHSRQPILWETMVFGGSMHQEMDRCSGSREQALAMHARMVNKVRKQLKGQNDNKRKRSTG